MNTECPVGAPAFSRLLIWGKPHTPAAGIDSNERLTAWFRKQHYCASNSLLPQNRFLTWTAQCCTWIYIDRIGTFSEKLMRQGSHSRMDDASTRATDRTPPQVR